MSAPSNNGSMLSNIIGFAMFGVATRMGHLGIQKSPLFHKPILHAVTGAIFGVGGYWIWRWDLRAVELIAIKREELRERRQRQLAYADAQAAAALANTN